MIITKRSILTGEIHKMDIPVKEEDWIRWTSFNPPLIQICFPYLTNNQREFILTGITPDEWTENIGDDPDDETEGFPIDQIVNEWPDEEYDSQLMGPEDRKEEKYYRDKIDPNATLSSDDEYLKRCKNGNQISL